MKYLALFLAACTVSPFDATHESAQRALRRGEINEALATYESHAQEAEKNALANWFPQQSWETAAENYLRAAIASRNSGRLQKSAAYGEKALVAALNAKNRIRQLSVIYQMIRTYRDLRQYDKIRELTEIGLVAAKQLPPNYWLSTQLNYQANLYPNLGLDYMRLREYEKAIDSFSQSVYLRQSDLSYVHKRDRRRPGLKSVESKGNALILELSFLGTAYLEAGKLGGGI